ncbi:MAG: hypothetical protein CR997_07585 [Acidobacteria bacterium]|nr:MAG: hypothetical protein CR997_07585 [Acidobacteriota bacterium]
MIHTRKMMVLIISVVVTGLVFANSDRTDNEAAITPGPQIGRAALVIEGTLGSGSPSIPFETGEQVGRLNRNGVPSTCAVPKVCDVWDTDPGRAYDAYTVQASGCVTIQLEVLEQTGANYQVNAYSTAFNPNDICANYLGDPGFSAGEPPTTVTSLSVNVPEGENLVVVVHTTVPGETGGDYRLTIDGDTASGGVPTLGEWGLIGFIGLFLAIGVALITIRKRQ